MPSYLFPGNRRLNAVKKKKKKIFHRISERNTVKFYFLWQRALCSLANPARPGADLAARETVL